MKKPSKAALLVSQSQIFKDSFISTGKSKYPLLHHFINKIILIFFLIMMSKKPKLLVMYGSQSGVSRGYASRLAAMAELCKIPTLLLPISEYH